MRLIAAGGHGGLPVPARMRGNKAGTCVLVCNEGGGEGDCRLQIAIDWRGAPGSRVSDEWGCTGTEASRRRFEGGQSRYRGSTNTTTNTGFSTRRRDNREAATQSCLPPFVSRGGCYGRRAGGGEGDSGRQPRADWVVVAFFAFLPLCLEDSRAPPQPISAPIPPLHPILPHRIASYTCTTT